jgi:hypothetical protein
VAVERKRPRRVGRPTPPRVSGSRRTSLEAWVEHPRRYLSWVRLVRMKFSCDYGRVDVLPAQIQAFDSQLAEVEVLSVKTLHLFDSAFNLSVYVALRDREGTPASAADCTAFSTSLGRCASQIQARTTNKAMGITRRAFLISPNGRPSTRFDGALHARGLGRRYRSPAQPGPSLPAREAPRSMCASTATRWRRTPTDDGDAGHAS